LLSLLLFLAIHILHSIILPLFLFDPLVQSFEEVLALKRVVDDFVFDLGRLLVSVKQKVVAF
jgi:hypothetical protein